MVVSNALVLSSFNGREKSVSDMTSTAHGPEYPMVFTHRIKPWISYSPSPQNLRLDGS